MYSCCRDIAHRTSACEADRAHKPAMPECSSLMDSYWDLVVDWCRCMRAHQSHASFLLSKSAVEPAKMTWLDLDPKFGTELTTYVCGVFATNNCMSVRRPSSVHTRAVISETYGDETTRWRRTLGCAMRTSCPGALANAGHDFGQDHRFSGWGRLNGAWMWIPPSARSGVACRHADLGASSYITVNTQKAPLIYRSASHINA